MAVPASGTLSMQDIAQERLNNTYGSGSVTGPISMYNLINGGNTGGAVTSGLAIYDTMQFIKSPVSTIVIGQACSMGSFLAMAGEPGKRNILPNAR